MLKSKFVNKQFSLLFISLAFLLLYYTTNYYHHSKHSLNEEFKSFSYFIDIQSVKMSKLSSEMEKTINDKPDIYWNSIDSILNNSSFMCFVSENDSLRYWNNSIIDHNILYKYSLDGKPHCIKLSTGWYLYHGSRVNNKTIQLFDLIKTDFQVDNRLLVRGFSESYSRSNNMQLTLDKGRTTNTISDKEGRFLIGVIDSAQKEDSHHTNILVLVVFMLSYIFLLFAIHNYIINLNFKFNNQLIKYGLFVLSTIIIWSIIYFSNFPINLKSSSLFTLDIYDIPLSTTAGDLILNTFTIVILSITTYNFFLKQSVIKRAPIIIIQYSLLWLFILLILFLVYHIAFDRNFSIISESSFLSYNSISYITVLIGLNIALYFIFLTYLNTPINGKIPKLIPFIIILFEVPIIIAFINIPISIIIVTVSITVILILLKHIAWKHITDTFLKHLILLIILSTLSALIINFALNKKLDKEQKSIVSTLSVSNDSILEKQYPTLLNKIINDEYLTKIIFSDSETTDSDIEQYLKYKYFNGYYDRYKLQVTNCTDDQLIEIQPEGSIFNCTSYFNSLITDLTVPVNNAKLHKFNSGNESIYYISNFILSDPNVPNIKRNIFLEFISSHVPEGLGYPELLVDSKSQTINLANYSFAKYSDNILSYKFGDYSYTTYISKFSNFKFDDFFTYNGYRHIALKTSSSTYIIVSKKLTPATLKLVIYSLIFIMLTIVSVLLYMLLYARKAIYLFKLNFKTRLQTFILATLTSTFILMAIATLVYFEDNSNKEIEKQLTEKTNSVLIELQHKLSSISDLKNEDSEFLHQLLRKFSLVFFSDINLYDKSGVLIATSRPEIFEKSLLSSLINPAAYNAIFNENELNYLTEENIGLLKYYSSYVPISLNSNSPIGIVNLPYFARQSEYTESYYIMLSYLLNIYVIIGIIGTLIAITFSKYLTRPLVLLHDSISNISIDKHNEKIKYDKNDEIGLLIKEYNRMVEKLEQSAELLKLSERESAWRDVAKQIAHEIKNPLTPMKLNVQYLEKSFKNNDPEFASKIDSVSKSLIAQIDTLNNVAEMFSNFANTKSMQFGKVDLHKILVSSVNLFNKEKHLKINLKFEESKSSFKTYGSEKDILRVVNNILKNAIQAVDHSNSGEVNISVNKKSKFIEVVITDNGKGISDEMKSNIFQPYFTTKTSGTGLGLAIVKNIMNEIGGKVTFKSELLKGTSFILNFPDSDKTS
jgi:signal transduction histidine kinase